MASTLRSLAAAVAVLTMAQPVAAQCWEASTLAAARIYEFHIKVKVVELRCNTAGQSIANAYVGYFERHGESVNDAVAVINETLSEKNGFAKDAARRYAVAVSNRSGGGRSSSAFCSGMRRMLAKLSKPESTVDELETFALVMARDPVIEEFCDDEG